jgi:phenylacetate-CoA ligase
VTAATCFQPDVERLDRSDLEQLQLERLEATLSRVHRNVPFYRERFDRLGFDPEGLRGLGDLAALPFTTKEDLRLAHPYGLFAVPLRDVVRLHASSGTTGQPTVVGYTRNDLKTWADLVARLLVAGGVGRDDVVQVAFNYGLFTGAFGLHAGAERLGCSVIPASSGQTRKQLSVMQDYRTTALVSTPSYALQIADTMVELGLDRNALALRHGLFGAEPWSEGLRHELEERLGITATDNYGLSEVMGPGVAGECLARGGLHLAEDHFLVEVVHPETLAPVARGELGELVITTLTREAFPLIRYRTRDLTRLLPGECGCGRTLGRMARVAGRTDDLLIVKGAKFFPSQVEAVLVEVEGAEPHFLIEVERTGALDQATVLVEVSAAIFSDEVRRMTELKTRLERRLASELGVTLEVKLVGRGALARSDGKASRVVDHRAR